jgi:hypothetical protein
VDNLAQDISRFLGNDEHWALDRAINAFFARDEFSEAEVNRQPKGAPESAGGQFAKQGEGAAGGAAPASKKTEALKGSKGSKPYSEYIVSSRNPSAAGRGKAEQAQQRERQAQYNRPDIAGMKLIDENYQHNMRLFGQTNHYPNLRPAETQGKTADEIATAVKNHIKGNLRFLYDNAPADVREHGAKWYEGANRMAEEKAKEFGLPVQTVAAVYAMLSPQKLWDMNVYLADRTLEIWRDAQNERWSTTMEHAAMAKRAKAGLGAKGTPEQKAAIIAKAQANKDREFAAIRGKTLAELSDPKDKFLWITLYDEARQFNEAGDQVDTIGYQRLSPDGRVLGDYLNKDGSKASAVWQTAKLGSNAIQALESDGDRAVISRYLGGEHKVRSFYNNILDPHSENWDVTMDTHAIGAAWLRALGGSSVAVAHALATNPKGGKQPPDWISTKQSDISGAGGLYGVYADAYRELAADLEIEPRVLQSITWEAKRRLFDDDMLETVNTESEQAWRDYHDGTISQQEAQQRVLRAAGGMTGKRLSGTAATPEQLEAQKQQQLARARERRAAERAEREREQQSGDRSGGGLDARPRGADHPRGLHLDQLGRIPRPMDLGRGKSDPGRAAGLEQGRSLDDAINAFFHGAQDFTFRESDVKRDPKGRFAEQAGSKAASFVSPNVESGVQFTQARQALSSSRQKALAGASQRIDQRLGLHESQSSAVIGAWATGAENSLMTLTAGDPQLIRAAACIKGALANQLAVLVFQPGAGQDAMASFDLTGDLEEIHGRLLSAGLEFHTLQPTERGATVHILVQNNDTAAAIYDVAGDNEITLVPGTGEFIGTESTEGTDAEQRADAQRVYRETVDRVAGGSEDQRRLFRDVWQDADDYWRAQTASQDAAFDRAIARFFAGDAEFRESDVKRDPQGRFAEQASAGEGETELQRQTAKRLDNYKRAAGRYGFVERHTDSEGTVWFRDDNRNFLRFHPVKEFNDPVRWQFNEEKGTGLQELYKVLDDAGLTMGPSPKTDAQKAIESTAHDTAKRLGFRTADLSFSDEIRYFNVGTERAIYAGGHVATGPEKGKITIYSKNVNEQTIRGIVAHEVMHNKFMHVFDAYEAERKRMTDRDTEPRDVFRADGTLLPEYEDEYPIYAAMQPLVDDYDNRQKLREADGVTEYSADWWKAFEAGRVQVNFWRQAVNETLAEMAWQEERERDPFVTAEREGFKPPRLVWKRLYNTINKLYKQHYWPTAGDREFRESDVKRDEGGRFATQASSGGGEPGRKKAKAFAEGYLYQEFGFDIDHTYPDGAIDLVRDGLKIELRPQDAPRVAPLFPAMMARMGFNMDFQDPAGEQEYSARGVTVNMTPPDTRDGRASWVVWDVNSNLTAEGDDALRLEEKLEELGFKRRSLPEDYQPPPDPAPHVEWELFRDGERLAEGYDSSSAPSKLIAALQNNGVARQEPRDYEEFKARQEQRRKDQIYDAATKTATDLGYDMNRIRFSDEVRKFSLAGTERTSAGTAYISGDELGDIVIYTHKDASASYTPQLVAHEVMHQKYQSAYDDWRADSKMIYGDTETWHRYTEVDEDGRRRLTAEAKERFPVYAAMDEFYTDAAQKKLQRADGVSDYSTDYWKDYKAAPNSWAFDLAVHETLAEMARIEHQTGEVKGGAIFKRLYKTTNDLWKKYYWGASRRYDPDIANELR